MLTSNIRQVRLRWSGAGLVFEGGPDEGVQIVVDSDGKLGQTPTQLLLMALAGCMAVDVLMILEKSRVPVESLEVEAIGERAETVPKRFVSVKLLYRLGGPTAEDQSKLDRAIELSRDKYCSVLHTLDPEIDFDLRVERA
ncbi:MAG: OsmC family protein [Gemmatimonadetes bacterium]|nr:OsmC family protein [Gemmatimonadota bacterium]MDA1104170.1 OsmC family protein [Gemmatimonadota bacterium]